MQKTKIRASYFYFLIFAFLFFFVFRALLLNIKTNLLDWGDPPFVIWQINQSVEKIKTLNFPNFFETNAFYPNKLTLLFSDILLPQAIMYTPLSFFSDNPIFIFNILFIITFLLNYISAFLFWRQIFKKDTVGFLGALFTVFSPFFHLQLGHFQMISFWPFLFTLYFIFKNNEEKRLKNLILAGIFLAIQFLTSVYLSIFLAFSIFLYYTIELVFTKNKRESLKGFAIIFLTFLVLDGVFIKGYLDVKKLYNIKRDIHEYILYSAHLSDYLFTTPINSLIHKSKIINRWNKFDKHVIGEKAAFPGFTLFILSLAGFLAIKTNKEKIFISAQISKENLFFLALIIFGFWFSLGPRLNFNGNYAEIPTGYNLLLKYISPLESMRAVARWSFLFYIGLSFFSLKTISNFIANKKLLILLFLIFILEYIPIQLFLQQKIFKDNYKELAQLCNDKNSRKVLLVLPAYQYYKGYHFPYYLTSIPFYSLNYKCYLVNGYSGYLPESIFKIESNAVNLLKNKQEDTLLDYLKKKGIDLLFINKKWANENLLKNYFSFKFNKITQIKRKDYDILIIK